MSIQVLYFLKLFFIYLAVLGPNCGLWDQFPDQGSNMGPLHWEHRVLDTGPTGKSPFAYFFFLISFCVVVCFAVEL